MNLENVVGYAQWAFLAYFVGINGGYLLQKVIAMIGIRRHLQVADQYRADIAFSSLDLPVSVVVPAFNEAQSIVGSVRALLQLKYSQFELVVVNDGSTDGTLDRLIEAFDLRRLPDAYRRRVPCAEVRGVYRSARIPNLRVVDKEHGGSKADASNAGINECRHPLVCFVDADSLLQPDSLCRIVRPFLEDSRTVAVGGTVRIANGCRLRGGRLEDVGRHGKFLALVQVVEYLRAFLFGRMGWSSMNALLSISGAFGMFDRETLVRAGGYDPRAASEDTELVLRLHRLMKGERRPYRIAFVPDPVCWTDAPESLGELRRQRTRWQHGLGQALSLNRSLIVDPRGGALTWVAIPFCLVFELFGPLFEVAGYLFYLLAGLSGWLSWPEAGIFLGLAVGLGVLLSTSTILLEDLSFHVYTRTRDLLKMYLVAILENFGYRQLTALWRLQGLFRWLGGTEQKEQPIRRSNDITSEAS